MNHLIESIVNKDHTTSKELFEQYMNQLMNEKLDEVKKMIAARIDEVTVHPDGMVHTSTGRHILPSVRRAELQLSEGRRRERAEIVKYDTKKTRENIKKAKERIAAKKKKEESKIAPLMSPERKEELRQRTARMAEKRAERLKNKEKREAAKREAAEKEAAYAKARSENPPREVRRAEGSSNPEIPGTLSRPLPPFMSKTKIPFSTKVSDSKQPVEKKPGLLKRIFGLKEEALARAKAIVEAKSKAPSMGTGSTPIIGRRTSTIEIENPEGQKETIIAGSEKRSSGRARKGRKLARELGAEWKRPGTYETNI